MAFSVLDLVQKNLSAIQENYVITTEVQHLKQQMTIDFNRFHNISYDPGIGELRLRNPNDSISYTFSDNLVVRNFDTVSISVQRVQFLFLGNVTSEGKIDAIKVYFDEPLDKFIFISKKNDAKTYFD